MTDITVIIPNYNGQEYIEKALRSLTRQTYQNFITLIVDDGSNDQSIQIAKTFENQLPQLEIHELENIGITANWNRAVQMVNTDFFCLLHFDDELEPTYLEKMRNLSLKDSEIGIVHCASMTIDENSIPFQSPVEQYKINRFFKEEEFCHSLQKEFSLLLGGSYITCPSVFYRKSAYDKIGVFNETYKMVQDWEYWFRVILSGYKICGTREMLFRYRRHGANASVKHSSNLIRYEEEYRLINWAHEQGIQQDYIPANTPAEYGLILKTVTVDIAIDLENSLVGEAKKKLDNVLSLIPANHSLLIVLLLRVCILLRKPGGFLLNRVIHFSVYLFRFFS